MTLKDVLFKCSTVVQGVIDGVCSKNDLEDTKRLLSLLLYLQEIWDRGGGLITIGKGKVICVTYNEESALDTFMKYGYKGPAAIISLDKVDDLMGLYNDYMDVCHSYEDFYKDVAELKKDKRKK